MDVNLITTFHEYDQDQAKGIACGRTKGHGDVKVFGDNSTRKTAATRCPVERGREGGGGAIFLGHSYYRTTETGIKFGRVGLIACMRLYLS